MSDANVYSYNIQARQMTNTASKRLPIREGDKFKSSNGQVWTVFDCMGFGRGYWVHSEDRRYQTIYQKRELDGMERA